LPRGCKRRIVPRASLPDVSVPGRHGRIHVRPQPSSEWRRHGPKDHHSRHRATRLAASGGGRAVCGYAVIGLPFRSGHILSLSRFPASSAGSAQYPPENAPPPGAQNGPPPPKPHTKGQITRGERSALVLRFFCSRLYGQPREMCWRLVWPPLRVYALGDLDPLAQPRQFLLYLPLSEIVEIPLAERRHAMAVDCLVLFPEGS